MDFLELNLMQNRYFSLNHSVGKYFRIFYDKVLWSVSKNKKNIGNIEAK